MVLASEGQGARRIYRGTNNCRSRMRAIEYFKGQAKHSIIIIIIIIIIGLLSAINLYKAKCNVQVIIH